MVSTRQMTIGNNGETTAQQPQFEGPAKFTRNCTTAMANFGGTSSGTVQCVKALPTTVQSINFLDLPQEVIEKIFSYLSYKNVCQLRLVSHRIDTICAQILNSTFLKLQNQMLQRFQDIKSKMPRRESARRSHYLACESDIIETLHMRLTLLQMSFGKHIERKHCCFFPGEILDEVYHILHYIKTTPKLDLPYKVTDELFDLSTMAMEYFKEKIEPNLPEIAYFSADFLNFSGNFPSTSSSKYLSLESSTLASEVSKDSDHNDTDVLDSEDLVETMPQSNMVLRKRIRKIKQGMKRYNSQLSLLRQDLRSCKKKTVDQQKQISEQQKQIADQQKQTLEYATRLDECDKKNEEMSRKFSTLLQELNKCKTELQYWRCKSPSVPPFCTSCGNPVLPEPAEFQALMNQGVNPEGLGLEPLSEFPSVLSMDQSTSTTLDEEVTKNEKHPKDEVKEIKELIIKEKTETPPTSPASVKNLKRKSEEPKEESSTTTTTTRKTRRLSKMRSKRVKV